ncbi:Smad nuclear-interacting protein 1 [Psilocybe cubensis]|uniref:Smad nuclear-interacting protein 1 n=2 Tax=Psilocybe cubensis TaxID=181762 RepID=A0ACB8GY69_PSICU|nr:Smad nuclear-interacting protein 1 [Psilocybe cubensis]KAH9480327.1 Smad nuclear-interacting protein 1 [Psilocybe cubensis]
MSRRSRSPKRSREYEDGALSSSVKRGSSRERGGGYESRRRERDYGSSARDRDLDRDRERDRERDYHHRSRRNEDRWSERDSRGYDERRRERERERDRERYDSARDRDRYSSRGQRRSASPRSRGSRSGSPSGQDPADKSKPNFAPSGLLAAETNTVKAVDGTSTVLKYNEPPEARKPVLGWRLYVFKDAEQVELLHIHRQSAYLVGRDRLVADIAVDHPSCSKQHAVFQYRYVQEKDEFGSSKGVVKPFVIDLESTNGTLVNDETIPPARYYELKAGDVIKFGLSTKEYVLLHDEAS